jgi:chemotaxis family two-component system sensor histidine kinase/response regulator PixL
MVAANQKPAELKLVGTQVLIDKVIVEKLYDPLLHLIRNAYDHGLESADVRRQQGKSETGQITVEAYHQGNRSYIKISDDGKGLDWKRIRVKAVEKNLLTQQEADSLPEAQLAEVLFEPGFSTKEKVSQLSGRGIGLDVVRSQLQAVQGSISVHSELGKSTTFVLQFPLSLTTARLLICQSQGIVYALISEVIDQVVLPQPEQIKHQQSKIGKHQQSFLCWGDKSDQELIPIHPLTNLINYQHPSSFKDENTSLGIFPLKPRNSVNPLLMLKHQKQRLCLEVEQILVEQELVIKSLGNNLTLPNYIQGYSVLGDGSLTLVIEPEVLISQIEKNTLQTNWGNLYASSSSFKILNRFEEEQPQDSVMQSNNQNTNTEQNSSLRKSIKILVVDDSIVQRQTLIANLTSANYQVLQAGNGQEALAQLNKHSDIQLIICDIEMPHMNGFEFLSHWRQDSRFPEIPVMMLTTRSGEKHRHLALALGAKAYFTKPHSQPELLEQITKILGQSNFELRTQNLELSKP